MSPEVFYGVGRLPAGFSNCPDPGPIDPWQAFNNINLQRTRRGHLLTRHVPVYEWPHSGSNAAVNHKGGMSSSGYYIDKLLFEASAIHRIMRFYSNSIIGSGAISNISAFVTMSTQVPISYQVSSRSTHAVASEEASGFADLTRSRQSPRQNRKRPPKELAAKPNTGTRRFT